MAQDLVWLIGIEGIFLLDSHGNFLVPQKGNILLPDNLVAEKRTICFCRTLSRV
jgi:hypothetical protein